MQPQRALRGGSWNNNGRNYRSAYRNHNERDNANRNIGLRLVQLMFTVVNLTSVKSCPVILHQANVSNRVC
jgi:hypothetical protein